MILSIIYSFFAALFFSFLFNVPKRSIIATAFIAGVGYAVYILISNNLGIELVGYFFGTFIMAILSEIAARIMKMATTTFITIAVIPLVPGLGLYKTMEFLVKNDYSAAIQTGTNAMLAAGTIAMAIAVNTLLVKLYIHFSNNK
jgi:uncharacterized membrane protein YjjB (DUF3815 family)